MSFDAIRDILPPFDHDFVKKLINYAKNNLSIFIHKNDGRTKNVFYSIGRQYLHKIHINYDSFVF